MLNRLSAMDYPGPCKLDPGEIERFVEFLKQRLKEHEQEDKSNN